MGSEERKPDTLRFPISEYNRDLFARANIARLVLGKTKEQFFADLLQDFLDSKIGERAMRRRWVRYSELELEMAGAGFTINRTTLWNYARNRPEFASYIKGDGIDVVWDVENIIDFFRKQYAENNKTTSERVS